LKYAFRKKNKIRASNSYKLNQPISQQYQKSPAKKHKNRIETNRMY